MTKNLNSITTPKASTNNGDSQPKCESINVKIFHIDTRKYLENKTFKYVKKYRINQK